MAATASKQYTISNNGYQGQYGPKEDDSGNIAYFHLDCEDEENPDELLENKQLIIVVDRSGSMKDSIKDLKNSLFAFRDLLLGRRRGDPMNEEELDQRLRAKFNLLLITFDDVVEVVYDSQNGKTTWDAAVNSITARHTTNMGGAIKKAYECTDPKKYTWIVVMTDGMSNEGSPQSFRGFHSLKTKEPANTRTITIGYGHHYDVKVLEAAGEFTLIRSQEDIPGVFGSIAHEFLETWGFGAHFQLPENASYHSDCRLVIGKEKIGPLYGGREYGFGLVLSDEIFDRFYKKGGMSFTYDDIRDDMTHVVKFGPMPICSGQIPNHVKAKYYQSEKGRRMNSLQDVLNDGDRDMIQEHLEELHKELESWNDDVAVPHADELFDMIEDVDENMNRNVGYKRVSVHIAARSCSARVQGGHNATDKEMTPAQRDATQRAELSAGGYEDVDG